MAISLRKLAGQTAVYGVSNILSRLLHLLLTPLYTHLFAPAEYGIYTNLYAWVAFVQVVLTFGMETSFFRFIQSEKDPDEVFNRAFSWVSVLSVVFWGIMLLLAGPAAGGMDYEGQGGLILIMAGIVGLDAIAALPLARLRHQEKAFRFSLITLANSGLIISLNLICVLWLDLGLIWVFIANLIASAFRLGMALYRNLPGRISLDPTGLKPMISYGFYIMLAGVAGIMNETLDRILLPALWTDGAPFRGESFTGEALNGIYGANYKLAMLIALAAQAFRFAAEPFYFKEAGNKESPLAFARLFHYVMIGAMAGFLVVSSFAGEIAGFNLFGLTKQTFIAKEYWAGLEVVPVLLLAYVFSTAYQNFSIWFKLTNRTRFALLFTGAGAAITVIFNVIGIPFYAYMACAWATLVAYASMAVGCYVLGQKYYPVPYALKRLAVYGLVIGAAWYINDQIGYSGDFFLAWLYKSGITLLALGGILGWEKLAPALRTT